jgi:hypothetical protein
MTSPYIQINGAKAMPNGLDGERATSADASPKKKPTARKTKLDKAPEPADDVNKIPHVVIKSSDWQTVVAVGSFILAGFAWMASNGYIDPPVHRSEMTLLSSKVVDIERSISDNKNDHEKMNDKMDKLLSGVSRVEGALGQKSKH